MPPREYAIKVEGASLTISEMIDALFKLGFVFSGHRFRNQEDIRKLWPGYECSWKYLLIGADDECKMVVHACGIIFGVQQVRVTFDEFIRDILPTW